jgi:hypothetical protein
MEMKAQYIRSVGYTKLQVLKLKYSERYQITDLMMHFKVSEK